MVSFQNYVDSGDRHIQKSESSFAETVRHAKTARYSPWHCIYLLFAENMPYTETAHNHTVAHLFHFIYIWFFLHCASHTHCCVRAETSRRPLAWAVRKCICCERQPRNWMWILVYLFSSASKLVLHAAAHTQSSAYIHPLRLTMLLLDLVWKKKTETGTSETVSINSRANGSTFLCQRPEMLECVFLQKFDKTISRFAENRIVQRTSQHKCIQTLTKGSGE